MAIKSKTAPSPVMKVHSTALWLCDSFSTSLRMVAMYMYTLSLIVRAVVASLLTRVGLVSEPSLSLAKAPFTGRPSRAALDGSPEYYTSILASRPAFKGCRVVDVKDTSVAGTRGFSSSVTPLRLVVERSAPKGGATERTEVEVMVKTHSDGLPGRVLALSTGQWREAEMLRGVGIAQGDANPAKVSKTSSLGELFEALKAFTPAVAESGGWKWCGAYVHVTGVVGSDALDKPSFAAVAEASPAETAAEGEGDHAKGTGGDPTFRPPSSKSTVVPMNMCLGNQVYPTPATFVHPFKNDKKGEGEKKDDKAADEGRAVVAMAAMLGRLHRITHNVGWVSDAIRAAGCGCGVCDAISGGFVALGGVVGKGVVAAATAVGGTDTAGVAAVCLEEWGGALKRLGASFCLLGEATVACVYVEGLWPRLVYWATKVYTRISKKNGEGMVASVVVKGSGKGADAAAAAVGGMSFLRSFTWAAGGERLRWEIGAESLARSWIAVRPTAFPLPKGVDLKRWGATAPGGGTDALKWKPKTVAMLDTAILTATWEKFLATAPGRAPTRARRASVAGKGTAVEASPRTHRDDDFVVGHGDFWGANCLLDLSADVKGGVANAPDRARIVAVDWSEIGISHPSHDFVQYLISDVKPDVRRAVMEKAVSTYVRELGEPESAVWGVTESLKRRGVERWIGLLPLCLSMGMPPALKQHFVNQVDSWCEDSCLYGDQQAVDALVPSMIVVPIPLPTWKDVVAKVKGGAKKE